jgi:hypothetical protein
LVPEGRTERIDVSAETLDEGILRSNSEIVPWKYAWYKDILGWMRGLLPSEEKVEGLAPK